MCVEALMPGQQGAVVVRTKAMPVFDDERLLHCLRNLRHGRNDGISEDVTLNPWIVGLLRGVLTDGVQQHQSIVSKQTSCGLKIGLIVARTDMFEHTQRIDAIKLTLQRAVVA